MEFSFTYTFIDYKEAARAVRKPPRTSKQARPSILFVVLTGIACAALLIAGTVIQNDPATGEIHPTPLGTFLLTLIPWVLILGAAWSVAVRRANPAARASIGKIILVFLLTGICVSILFALTPGPPVTSVRQTSLRQIPLQIAPWIVLLIGCFVGFLMMLKTLYRRMWDGMPHLRLPHTARFSDDRAEFENTNALCSYRWPAFVIFRETPNLFVLQTSKYTFHMFPKRACRDGAQIDELRRLIEKNVANAEPVVFGFAVVPNPPPSGPPRMVESLPPRRMN